MQSIRKRQNLHQEIRRQHLNYIKSSRRKQLADDVGDGDIYDLSLYQRILSSPGQNTKQWLQLFREAINIYDAHKFKQYFEKHLVTVIQSFSLVVNSQVHVDLWLEAVTCIYYQTIILNEQLTDKVMKLISEINDHNTRLIQPISSTTYRYLVILQNISACDTQFLDKLFKKYDILSKIEGMLQFPLSVREKNTIIGIYGNIIPILFSKYNPLQILQEKERQQFYDELHIKILEDLASCSQAFILDKCIEISFLFIKNYQSLTIFHRQSLKQIIALLLFQCLNKDKTNQLENQNDEARYEQFVSLLAMNCMDSLYQGSIIKIIDLTIECLTNHNLSNEKRKKDILKACNAVLQFCLNHEQFYQSGKQIICKVMNMCYEEDVTLDKQLLNFFLIILYDKIYSQIILHSTQQLEKITFEQQIFLQLLKSAELKNFQMMDLFIDVLQAMHLMAKWRQNYYQLVQKVQGCAFSEFPDIRSKAESLLQKLQNEKIDKF